MIMLHFVLLFVAQLGLIEGVSVGYKLSQDPTVQIKNGTLLGSYDANSNQDLFLGIPFAKPPINSLRFERPEPLTERWLSPREVKKYGPFCHENSVGLMGYDQNVTYLESEDCLTVNVVRPHCNDASTLSEGLPVLVWVYGGGFQQGGSGDPRYNLTHLVNESARMGKPIVGVSFNYRTNVFGFVSGQPFVNAGKANLGLHDQRLALRWIQENIPAFRGDPKRVTLQGESAGALSIGLQLLVNNGRDDGLFHRAILESGSPFFAHSFPQASDQQSILNQLSSWTNCSSAVDIVSCLRAVPAPELAKAAARTPFWRPVIDGDLLSQLPSKSIENGNFIGVPLLIGTNTNEGTAFLEAFRGGKPVNSAQDVHRVLQVDAAPFVLPNETIDRCHELYLAVMEDAPERHLGTVLADPGTAYGQLHGELSLILGDSMFNSGRRITTRAWATRGIPAYSYRFDTNSVMLSPKIFGSAHFQEIPFIFGSNEGKGYDSDPLDTGRPHLTQKYLDLSHLMTRMWLSFVQTGSPNNHGVEGQNVHWPKYDIQCPVNIVFNATHGTALESDNYRQTEMEFFWGTARVYNR